jgi:hypothetical protein
MNMNMSIAMFLHGNRSDSLTIETRRPTSSPLVSIIGTPFISRGTPEWADITPEQTAEVVPFDITTFEPEPYRLLHPPMKAYVTRKGLEYIASQLESNIHASGDSEFEAQENLRSLILDTFEILTEEPEENLAPRALRQLLVLREHIAHT